MKKNILTGSLIVIIAIMSVLLSLLYVQNKSMNEELSRDNLGNWTTMFHMTNKIENNVKTIEDIKTFALYQNTIIHTISDELTPAFQNNELANSFAFLSALYDPLMQDLSYNEKNKDVDDEILSDGFELYIEMNADLKKLCEFVISSAENNPNSLLNPDSHIHKEIQSKIDDYCIKYDERMTNFFNQINSSLHKINTVQKK
ncbi:hypothetical protein AN639_01305 [Candidatus Epulonipiscium fishelsonii]|uniref:Uncharacterized protein n=1 Tax=Candidatus Epulonipiscium fishelsonii TaxID=77094 RepID=A0ACC8XBQ7_9FIRM|nr:hypothetical protein AN639_01305 [Epulopiscium sp. SCG-B05WGA-EpuloA1]ONI40033.1 hypothetical protein AN396_06700 [Epulopiscium sp. SCG-B11WGA-EpuloA1]